MFFTPDMLNALARLISLFRRLSWRLTYVGVLISLVNYPVALQEAGQCWYWKGGMMKSLLAEPRSVENRYALLGVCPGSAQ